MGLRKQLQVLRDTTKVWYVVALAKAGAIMQGFLDLLDHPAHPTWWQIVIIVLVLAGAALQLAWLADRLTNWGSQALERWIQCCIIGVLFVHGKLKQPSSLLSTLIGLWLTFTLYAAVAASKKAWAERQKSRSH